MAKFEGNTFLRIILSLCILIVHSECRPANAPGTVARTKATNFRWFFEIANPCEATPPAGSAVQQELTTAAVTSTEPSPTIDFYHSMELALKRGLDLLESLEKSSDLPECNGISLDSLPPTPILDSMNNEATAQQIYKSVIFLTAHFHLMSSDRQMPTTGEELEGSLPLWRFQRCGNETENFPSVLTDLTMLLENIICTILSSATDGQTAAFRDSLNLLQKTVFYSYSTCSTLQTRDCLVIREAKQALNLIVRKNEHLIIQNYNAEQSGLNSSEGFDDMDNSI